MSLRHSGKLIYSLTALIWFITELLQIIIIQTFRENVLKKKNARVVRSLLVVNEIYLGFKVNKHCIHMSCSQILFSAIIQESVEKSYWVIVKGTRL